VDDNPLKLCRNDFHFVTWKRNYKHCFPLFLVLHSYHSHTSAAFSLHTNTLRILFFSAINMDCPVITETNYAVYVEYVEYDAKKCYIQDNSQLLRIIPGCSSKSYHPLTYSWLTREGLHINMEILVVIGFNRQGK